VSSPQKIPVIIALGDFASGVTSWAFRLREAFSSHPRYTIRLMNCAKTGNRIGTFDLEATTYGRAEVLLSAYEEAIIIPNFVWDLFPICAALNQSGHRLRCVGFCRADSEKEYYAPLRWYGPIVNQFAGVSPTCASRLAEHVGLDSSLVHTLPTGVWVPQSLSRAYQVAPLRIAYGGRIVQEQKRVFDFVPLVEMLYESKTDFCFFLVGTGRQRDELQAALGAVDPENRVHFVDRLKPEGMPEFWASQDAFIQTSAFEGTSNSMLESMAQGTVPVVTRTDSGVDGIVMDGENGFLADVGDMEAMAAALGTLARNEERLIDMGEKAHAATLPYSMAHYVEKFSTMLDCAMSESPRRWPEGRPLTPAEPFHGIRLAKEAGDGQKGRIAILFPSPLRGGAEDYTLTVARGAVRAGYDVQGGFSGRPELKTLVADYFGVGAFHNTLEICDVGKKAGQAPVYKRFTRTLRLMRRLKPKSVLFQLCGIQYGLVALIACACLRLPTLVVFQLVRDDLRFSAPRRALHRWMRHRGQRYVAVSENNRRLLSTAFSMGEEEIVTIPNGVDVGRFAASETTKEETRIRIRRALKLPREAVLCLSVGRLSTQKGHDVLIPAIPHLLSAHPNVHFLWAGDGPLQDSLRAQLETYGVTDHVTFLGNRDDIPDLLHAADLFVHPARFEGQPFSLLEAMAAGLPIVGTRASGITEVITEGFDGLLCRTDDVADLRDTLLHALENPGDMARLARAAEDRVNEFSEAAMIKKTLFELDSLGDQP
jgi:glycosyltransferase involved in cell wall biosynthesis